jgi:hypothetical protein
MRVVKSRITVKKKKPSNPSEKIFGAIAEILGGRVLGIEGVKFYAKICI